MNRHRFWMLALLAAMTACVPPANHSGKSPYASPQKAPATGQPLVPDAARADQPSTGLDQPVSQTVKVAVLLPLTGRHASLGKAMQDAANLSLFDKYARISPRQLNVRVELLPKDTGDTPEQAQDAMRAALNDGAQLVIGPVFAEDATAAAALARAQSVSMLSFSNNMAMAAPGLYMLGFSPAEQAERVVRYAIAAGKPRVAVLVPDSALGSAVVASARAAAASAGVPLAAEVRYSAQGVGLEKALATLVPTEGQPGFDALLMAEGSASLHTVLSALAARGVTQKNVQFLGTGLWDDAALLRRVNLEGAWVASSPSNLTTQFEQRFHATQNYAPPRLASLAYDAVALAVTLATSGRPFDAAALTGEGGFSGPANGIFRLMPNGQVQRGLAVMQVRSGALVVINPAPAGFVGR